MTAFARYRRLLATTMALLTGLGPIATPSYAALTKLADEPLAVKNSAKPNIVLTVDDSTSMLFDFLPDYIIGTFDSTGKAVKDTFCRDATGKMASRCGQEGMLFDLSSYPGGNRGKYISPGYIYEQFGYPFPAYTGAAAGYDASGPGEGCDRAAPRCNGGIDPGAAPGIPNYPANTAFAGQPYEYWLLWPAPVHNSALNHLYYNPRLTYEPPAKADGTRFDTMDATHTDKGAGPWTSVPADPFAASPVFVNLTTKVQVGQWCNSDWTQGINPDTGNPYATDPAYCRSNGTVAAASSGAPKADGDYMYPWAWPGGAAAQDAKYFYPRNTANVSGVTPNPNDNLLWCDATSIYWPANGALTVPQACNGYTSTAQTCRNATAQTCAGQSQTCGSLQSQTCNGSSPQTCNNITNTQTCLNSQTQTCKNITSQTCNNTSTQTCKNITSQTCNGYQTQTCTAQASQTCVGYVAPSCTNIKTVCTPPPPSSCTTTLGPPGCGGPEGPVCVPTTTCPPDTCVTSGTCANNGATCTSDANCSATNGACSITGATCQPANAATQCPATGHCSVNTGVSCNASNAATQCPAINGTCSKTGVVCQPANAATQCPAEGNCSVQTTTLCTSNANCPTISGTCSITGAVCTAANASTACPATGNCSVQTTTKCQSNANCPTINGTCSLTNAACTAANASTNCPTQGKCSVTGALCTAANAATTCPTTTGSCSITGVACTSSNAATNCPAQGKCSITNATCTSANAGTTCPVQNKRCSITGAACTTLGTDLANCPDQGGTCSITGLTCTNANAATACPAQESFGTCSVTGAVCGGSKGACPNVAAPATTATCSTLMNMGSKSLLEDANSTGVVCRRNNKAYSDISAGRFNYPSGRFTTAVTGGLGAATIWVEDAVPTGAAQTGDEAWTWVTTGPAPFSGSKAHQSVIRAGEHQHYFTGATTPIALAVGDWLFTYVYLDPANLPSEVMLQFYDASGSWEHRAYWGSNLIGWGSDGTNSRRFMGALPTSGQWVRLAVSAAAVGLEGSTITGMAFTLYNGRATFDYAGSAHSVTSGTAGIDACAPTPAYTTIPRHYWKTEVEWCKSTIGDAGDKWNGYGDGRSGNVCQSFHDSDHAVPRFYQFGSAPGTENYGTPAFQRVDLDIAKRSDPNAIPTHTWIEYDDSGNVVQTNTITRSFDEEMTNYANWFAYYRNRIQAVKTVTSLAFKELDDTYRVGLHTLSNAADRPFVDVADFGATQKGAWFGRLFGLSIALNQETPNLDAIVRVGEYYKDGASSELAGATDPIILSCQKNWHMLFTDGLTNQDTPKLSLPDQDNLVVGLAHDVLGLKNGDAWPPLYRENSNASVNAAADYITHYWVTDFRADGDVNGTTKASVGLNNVPTSDADPADWQHQNFAAMSLGTEGKLPSGNQSGTEKSLAKGDISWPQTLPNVNRPDESGVDDLWHAAVNGRGRFVNAQSADELRLGMGQILQDITNQAGSRAGVAFQNVNLSATNQYIYRVGFQPGWGGTLTKVQIDPLTGNEVAEVWRAADQLNNQVTIVPGVKDTPWYTERKIATMDTSGKPIPFLWDSLPSAQQDALSIRSPLETASATRGKGVLEFLRGSQQREGLKLNQFRVRKIILGDIADSQAQYVGPPSAPYLDTNDPGYSTFKSKYASRPTRIYVGANDGMLHAVDDATGFEAWAYVPLGIYRTGSTGPGALSLQDGALPAFQHHFYVDSTPRIIDVDFGSSDWRSLLVGGLGKGGRAYYAIDVTDPSAITTETELTKRIAWEFSDSDMGYSYGRPIIGKTRAFNGRWLVMVPSGYNNPSGVGKIFVLDATNGKVLKTLSTGSGDAGSPSGLAHIAGYVRDYRNVLTEQVYAGDLQGNLWRFDVSDPNPSLWKVEKLATLTDPSGNVQPVTTPPQIEIDIENGIDRWVFVGTGKLYHPDDLKDTQIQTMYAIRDGTSTTPAPITTTVQRKDLVEVKDKDGLGAKPDNGWYDDLPAGQRIIVPPQAAVSVVAYSSVSPQDDPCLTGQPAHVYARGYAKGDSLMEDDSGAIIESYDSPEGTVGLDLMTLGSSGNEGDVPNIVVGITLGTTGKLKPKQIKPPTFLTAHRMSWRLLGN